MLQIPQLEEQLLLSLVPPDETDQRDIVLEVTSSAHCSLVTLLVIISGSVLCTVPSRIFAEAKHILLYQEKIVCWFFCMYQGSCGTLMTSAFTTGSVSICVNPVL